MALPGNWATVPNSLVGGNIVSIVARQVIRLNALRGAAVFEAKKARLGEQAFNALNPVVYVAGVPVSVRTQETYTYQADVTEHALEDGVIYTDHVILKPLRIEASFEVVNWTPGEAAGALTLLETMFQHRVPLELLTTHAKVPDMVLVNLQAVNQEPAWGALEFRATFQQLRLVALETVKYDRDRVEDTSGLEPVRGGPDTGKSATTAVNKGQQQASTLKRLFSGGL